MTFLTIHPPPHITLTTNHLAFCMLLSHNNLSTNSRPRYAQPLGVGVNEEQMQ